MFGLGAPSEHWSHLIMWIYTLTYWVYFRIGPRRDLSNIPLLWLVIPLHQLCLGAGDESGRQRAFDLLYFSSCSLVFLIQNQITSRGWHWLCAGVTRLSGSSSAINILTQEISTKCSTCVLYMRIAWNSKQIKYSGVLQHHCYRLEIHLKTDIDLSRNFLFFSHEMWKFSIFLNIPCIWEGTQSVS